jgi:hypothetical protein
VLQLGQSDYGSGPCFKGQRANAEVVKHRGIDGLDKLGEGLPTSVTLPQMPQRSPSLSVGSAGKYW